MADLSDVENALALVVQAAVYPNGADAPSVLPSAAPCAIYRGWPNAAQLDADLRAGKVNVSIYAQPGVEKNTTRFPAEWKTLSVLTPKLTLTVVGRVVTVGGSIQATDIATIKLGVAKAYSVAVQANSTLASIASALAALVAVDFPAVAVGPAVTITTGALISVVVGFTGTSWIELRRQQKGFQVIVWASTPDQRDKVSALIDKAFAKVELSGFLTLADASAARLTYTMTRETDTPQKELLYRRDLFYMVEYPTTDTETDYSITSVVEAVKGGGSPPDAPPVIFIS